MAEPYTGEIRMFAGNFAPTGWAVCNGDILSIADNTTLFALIGTTYGGDGETTFALPDLRGRVPVHQGSLSGASYPLGQILGSEQVVLTAQTLPAHSHPLVASINAATAPSPANNLIAKSPQIALFTNEVQAPGDPLNAILPVGGSQPHENCQPFVCVNFIISLFGQFPQQ